MIVIVRLELHIKQPVCFLKMQLALTRQKIRAIFSQVNLRRQIHAKKSSHPPFKMLKATGFPAVMVCSEGESQGEKSSIREDTAQRQHSSTRLESQDV